MTETKSQLLSRFKGKDLGEAKQFLNMQIIRDRTNRCITIKQPLHIDSILDKFGAAEARASAVPIPTGSILTSTAANEQVLGPEVPYAQCVGALNYIANCTRPDLAYPLSVLSRFMARPTNRHWELCKHVLRYLKGTRDLGLTFGITNDELTGWVDADFAACKETRRSRTGYVFTLFGGAISWNAAQQKVVALSTAESEYIAACASAKEAVWLKRLCHELKVYSGQAVRLNVDNQAAKYMATTGALSGRTKHIDTPYHYVRDAIVKGYIELFYTHTSENLADLFTKPLNGNQIAVLVAKFGLV